MAWFRKVKAGLVTQDIENFVGETGNIFFNIESGEFRLSDGITPGGIPIGGGGGGGGGDVSKFGTPVNDQLAIWRSSTIIEGDSRLTWNGTNFTITGNVVVSGTVDGRDLSTDGIKLDGIEAGATADQTGAEITSSLDTYLGSTDWRSGGTGVTDGVKGEITVSGTGTLWTVNAGAITLAKLADLAPNSLIGNNTGVSATPIALSAAQTKALLGITSTDVSDFNEAVDDRVAGLLVAGANITLAYNDALNTLTIDSPTAVSLTGQWRFDSTTTMANPGNGDIRLNNAVMASVTQIAIAELSNQGVDTQNYLATLRVNDILYLQDEDDATKFGRFVINSTPTDNGTWWQFSVTHVNSGAGGTPANNQICRVAFLLNNGGGGGGSASAMSDLTDVDLAGLSDNDILVYNLATMTWRPEPNSGGTGSTFMPQVDLIDDTNATYYYFGWVDDGDGWQINRQTRTNALIERADSINNIAIPDLATAWPLRAGLTYS